MSPTLANFVFAEAINFALLAAALGWSAFSPVRRALDAEASATRRPSPRPRPCASGGRRRPRPRHARSADALEATLEARRRDVLAAADAQAAALVEEARAARAKERRALDEELETARAASARANAETLGRVAAEAVRRLLDALAGPSLDAALVRAACEELRALPAEERRAATVESARALDAESRQRLEEVLGASVAERRVEDLGAGVRVTTSAGQVDATARSIARAAAVAVVGAGHG
ncbi:MAG: hypothetical protein R3B82_11680 [Sandaracinaceae bacterium]